VRTLTALEEQVESLADHDDDIEKSVAALAESIEDLFE
jgi:hypothetical protein